MPVQSQEFDRYHPGLECPFERFIVGWYRGLRPAREPRRSPCRGARLGRARPRWSDPSAGLSIHFIAVGAVGPDASANRRIVRSTHRPVRGRRPFNPASAWPSTGGWQSKLKGTIPGSPAAQSVFFRDLDSDDRKNSDGSTSRMVASFPISSRRGDHPLDPAHVGAIDLGLMG
jgi:hypothetical protein